MAHASGITMEYGNKNLEDKTLGDLPIIDESLSLSYRDYLIRLVLDRRMVGTRPPVMIKHPTDAYKFLQPLENEPREIIIALYLDPNLILIGTDEIAKGNSENARCPPYEIMKGALLTNTTRILVAHNHPHGNPEPSAGDILFTKTIVEAASILGMKCIDHIIIGNGVYYSFLESGNAKWFQNNQPHNSEY